MEFLSTLGDSLVRNWHVWFVTITLIVAAVIDGRQLRVPNWLTYPFIISGWIFSFFAYGGMSGLGDSLLGTMVGMALLLPLYAIGGMGAGDVKLLAGVGAWVHSSATVSGFTMTAVVGAIIAVAMVLVRKDWRKHYSQFWSIVNEIMVIRNPEELAKIAAKRKSTMLLLPYGIPIAIGCIIHFLWDGLLI